jgi:phosphate transport system substrate-binding protein
MSVSEDDNVLVRGVTGDEGAIGFFGCAYYFENKDKVRAVAIDGGKGAVMPTVESIEDGSYAPFSRPLFIYVSKASAAKPEVRAFVDFYIKNAGRLAGEVGYVKLPDAVYSRVSANWTAGRTGSQFIDPKGEHISGSLAEFYK